LIDKSHILYPRDQVTFSQLNYGKSGKSIWEIVTYVLPWLFPKAFVVLYTPVFTFTVLKYALGHVKKSTKISKFIIFCFFSHWKILLSILFSFLLSNLIESHTMLSPIHCTKKIVFLPNLWKEWEQLKERHSVLSARFYINNLKQWMTHFYHSQYYT
jgi:hypothetical protein